MTTEGARQRFGRTTLVAAAELLERRTQAGFNQMVIRLELETEIPEVTTMSVQKKCARLARILANEAGREIDALDGRKTLGEAVVLEAVAVAEEGSLWQPQAIFEQSLAQDGYALRWTKREDFFQSQHSGGATLVAALPPELATVDTDDEVRGLLAASNFHLSQSHLEQAVRAHARGDWAAANGQLRTLLESLVMEIAINLGIENAELLTTENRLRALKKAGFLSSDRKEWLGDGKGFVNGLMKMLHTDGAHPGLSDADNCTFRLHVALVTARLWLRRLGDIAPQG